MEEVDYLVVPMELYYNLHFITVYQGNFTASHVT